MLAISLPILTNIALADPDEDDPRAYLTVHCESPSGDPITGVSVSVEVTDGGAVKVDDGSWFGGWGSSAATNTDVNGDAKFRLWRLIGNSISVRITACGQIVENSYALTWLPPFPSHTETIICAVPQVIPEAPMGTLGLSLAMLLGLALFLIRPRMRAITY